MNNNKLTIINQNSELALIKSKNLLDLTKKILDKKELVKTFSYDKKFLVKENKPYEFVNSLNKTFEEIMEELLKEINKL